jgi:Aldo/keto reductase family
MEALNDVVRAGKARYLGASKMAAWQFAKAQATAERNGWARFVSMQNLYNLVYREEEREMIPLCLDQGVGVIPYSPLARGLLARTSAAPTARAEGDPLQEELFARRRRGGRCGQAGRVGAWCLAGSGRVGVAPLKAGRHRAPRGSDQAGARRRRRRGDDASADRRRSGFARGAVPASRGRVRRRHERSSAFRTAAARLFAVNGFSRKAPPGSSAPLRLTASSA